MVTTPRVGIVIPVWNKVDVTLRCLEALVANTTETLYEVVIVDNASTDETPQLLAGLGGDVKVITNDENVGYTLASNQGAAATDAEIVLFLNNDTEPQPGWLDALLECFDRNPDVAVAGSKLVYPDGRLQEAGGLVFNDGSGWNFGRFSSPAAPLFNREAEVDYCSGASLAVRRTFLDLVGGGYDPAYAPAYYEDVDLCFAARAAGWKVRYVPASTVIHHEGITAGVDEETGYKRYQVINRKTFVEKWREELVHQEPAPIVSGIRPSTADRRLRCCGSTPRSIASGVRPGPQRVLMVEPLMPLYDQSAGSMRTYRILQHLRALGHDVTYIARNGANQQRYVDELEAMGVTVHAGDRDRNIQLGVKPDGHAELDLADVLRRGRFDVAWLSFPQLALQYLPLIRSLSAGTRIWVDSVDMHHVREQRTADLALEEGATDAASQQQRADDAKQIERFAYGHGDGVVTVTDTDAAVVRALIPGAVTAVVPTIHPVRAEIPAVDRRKGLLFVGNFGHLPNQDAVRWFCTRIMPRIKAKSSKTVLRVVGGGAPPDLEDLMRRTPGVEYLGWVEELDPVIDSARVSVAPLRVGSGMKGKIGDALAAGLPVVTTPVGAEGMKLVDGMNSSIADKPAEFATAVVALLRDDDLWTARSAEGRRHMELHFSDESVRDALTGIVMTPVEPAPLASGPRRARSPRPERRDAPGAVVFGMHRSGTSAMAQVLTSAGLDVGPPEQLMAATESNPHGHFELNPVVALNDRLLGSVGRYWHCPTTTPGLLSQRRFDRYRTDLEALLRQCLPATGWVLKDPRLSVMWDLYRPLFAAPPVGVFIVRNPADVAISLHTRDQMSMAQGLMLWEFYNRSAARALTTTDHAMVVDYDDLVAKPNEVGSAVRALLQRAGLGEHLSEQVDVPVDPSLNRSSLERSSIELPATAARLWEQLRANAAGDCAPIDEPGHALTMAVEARAARVAAHINALQRGWVEPADTVHEPDR